MNHVTLPAYRPVTSYDLALSVLLSRLNDVPATGCK